MEEVGQALRAARKHFPEAGIGVTFPAPFQASCAVPKPPPAKGADPAATGVC